MFRARGQLFATDAAFALLLIVFIFFTLVAVTNQMDYQIKTSESIGRLRESATNAANQLINTPGQPRDWQMLAAPNSATLYSIGIASEPNVLDPDKTALLFNLTNSTNGTLEVARLLALYEPGYNYSITITGANNTPIYSTLNTPPVSQREAASVDRVALLNQSRVRMTLIAWVEPTP